MIGSLDLGGVRRFRTSIERRLGLHFDDGKLDYLVDVLRERMEARRLSGLELYLDRIASGPEGVEEWRSLAERLTVSETYFFRYWDHFRAFSEVVLPACARLGSPSRELRILSAGCASGEEPYSLAVLIREHEARLFPGWQIKIAGVDVSPAMIGKARRGRYSEWSLRETSQDLRDRHFRREGRDYALDDTVRAMVTFEERNLVENDPRIWSESEFDVVFCRNVIMYFSAPVAREVIARIARLLRPGGYLFLGHAETLRSLSDEFHLRHTHETFYYQRRSPHETRVQPEAVAAFGTPAPLAESILETTGTWVEAIQRASERIAALAIGNGSIPVEAKVPRIPEGRIAPGSATQPTWDLSVALELLRNEKFSEAMEFLRALPPESTADPDAQLLRAVLLTNRGELGEAEKRCGELLELNELNAGAHYLMALCREHAGDRGAAADHDRTAVYLDPWFAMPRLHLGLMAKRAGTLDSARQELGQALVLLDREDASRILLFGGGFSREALTELCRRELRASGGTP